MSAWTSRFSNAAVTASTVLPRALREATRKAAQAERGRPRGDPMARRRERTHDRRMAVVTAIWEGRKAAEGILDYLGL